MGCNYQVNFDDKFLATRQEDGVVAMDAFHTYTQPFIPLKQVHMIGQT